jgi:predicted nucleotidyltransferase
MTRLDGIVATLRAHAGDLRRRGVASASIFGSAARGEDRQDSDVDIMVELEPEIGILAYSEIRLHLSDLLGRRVTLVTPGGLRPIARPSVFRDAIRVF